MEPSLTSLQSCAPSVISARSFRISTIRSMDARDMVTMTKIMESIIRLIKICEA